MKIFGKLISMIDHRTFLRHGYGCWSRCCFRHDRWEGLALICYGLALKLLPSRKIGFMIRKAHGWLG